MSHGWRGGWLEDRGWREGHRVPRFWLLSGCGRAWLDRKVGESSRRRVCGRRRLRRLRECGRWRLPVLRLESASSNRRRSGSLSQWRRRYRDEDRRRKFLEGYRREGSWAAHRRRKRDLAPADRRRDSASRSRKAPAPLELSHTPCW